MVGTVTTETVVDVVGCMVVVDVVGCTVVVEVDKTKVVLEDEAVEITLEVLSSWSTVELVCEVEVKVVVQRAVVMKATKITATDEVYIVELASDGMNRWNNYSS